MIGCQRRQQHATGGNQQTRTATFRRGGCEARHEASLWLIGRARAESGDRSHRRRSSARAPGGRQLQQILRPILQQIFRRNVASLPERPAEFARATLRSTVSDVQRHATATAQRRALRRKEQPPWDYRRAVRVLRQAGLSGRRFHTVRIVPESLSVARHSLSALDSRGLAQKVGPGGVPNLHHVVAL
jgi:hypothetical protein